MENGERDDHNADSPMIGVGSVNTPKKGQGGKTTAVFKSPAPSHKKGSNGSYNHYNNASSTVGQMAGSGSGLTSSQAQGTTHVTSYILKSPMVSSRSKFFNQNNDSNSKLFGNSFGGLIGPAAA